MGSSLVEVGPRLAAVLVLLAAVAATAGRLSGLRQERAVVVAVLRATVQLSVVSAVLVPVVGSPPLSARSCCSWRAPRRRPRSCRRWTRSAPSGW